MSFMMKERMESEELKLLRMIKAREGLVDDSRYWNLEKGYQGEMLFDKWFSGLEGEWMVVNDLLLEYAGSLFQIDSLVIGGDRVYLFEVKNFEGDFLFEKDRWYSGSKEIKDPLLQMQRCETALRQLLRSLGYQLPIESNLIFINPEYNLYNCPPKLPIVFCSQLNRFSTKLLKQSSGSARLNTRHSRLAEKLCELHIEKSPYERLPEYRYEELRKGIVCVGCGGMGVRHKYRTIECKMCGSKEDLDIALVRAINECCSLFPQMKITTKIIHDWIGEMVSKKVIQRVLHINFSLIGHGKSANYVKDKQRINGSGTLMLNDSLGR
ncbi:NERD domain-containing protein [Bacillus sp. RO2]|uniref:nuclease-related domain-containing protein n=1 Tax=Bacillus sp. RO2 TaxID=2723913 RepID=UPI00145E18B7|nr:nuclease-related domain-containing protein [Bacillus sp. RO2]NMH71460.1 NERD domain-containing protein [Bacillus sp. RO2]